MVPAFGHDLLSSLIRSVADGQVVVLCPMYKMYKNIEKKKSLTALIMTSADTVRAANDSNSQQMSILFLP